MRVYRKIIFNSHSKRKSYFGEKEIMAFAIMQEILYFRVFLGENNLQSLPNI